MSKGLDALKTLISHRKFGGIEAQWEREECRKTIEKELKALEFLKDLCNLKVCKNKSGQCFLEGTNILFPISKEEYNLLKEVML